MDDIQQNRQYIHDKLKNRPLSVHLLKTMIDLYDEVFLGFYIREKLKESYSTLNCELSRTTRIGGDCHYDGACHYTIRIAKPIIDNLFKKGEKLLWANGLTCHDMISCMQLVVEHELVHLLLFMIRKSDNHGPNFMCMVNKLFGHTEAKHELHKGDASERMNKEDFKNGDAVQFIYKNVLYKGIIIRMNKERANILVDGIGAFKIPYGMLRLDQKHKDDNDDQTENKDDNENHDKGRVCHVCKGTKTRQMTIMGNVKIMKCSACDGSGEIHDSVSDSDKSKYKNPFKMSKDELRQHAANNKIKVKKGHTILLQDNKTKVYIKATVIRVNSKTVTCITDDKEEYRVSFAAFTIL